jgi:hypothetical protein
MEQTGMLLKQEMLLDNLGEHYGFYSRQG